MAIVSGAWLSRHRPNGRLRALPAINYAASLSHTPSAIMWHLVEQVLVFGTPAAIAIVLTLRLPTLTDALWWSALGTAFAFCIAAMFTDPRGAFNLMALAIAAPIVILYTIVVVLLTDATRTIVRRYILRNRGGAGRGPGPPPG